MTSMMFLIIAVSGFVLVTAQNPYHGKKIAEELSSVKGQPALAGNIYVVDDKRIQIVGFTYPGTLSNGAFLMGTTQLADISDRDQTAMVVDVPGMGGSLGSYNGDRLVLSAPNGGMITSFKYFGIGASDTKELHYGVAIPADLVAPAPVVIGQFVTRAHQVSSGDVTVINDRTIMIRGFNYDGSGPDAFFYVGITDNVGLQSAPYGKIPDENGVIDSKAGRYRNKDIVLTLPDTLSARNIKWLSMFCISFRHNFGEVMFSGVNNIPPYIEMVTPQIRQSMNCESLSEDLQVSWMISGSEIMFELAGRIDRNTDYMAFGLSGDDSTFKMVDSDIVVVDYKDSRQPRAVDYYITDYAQCSTNGGVCPDTSSFLSSTNDITMASGEVSQGVTRVSYARALVTRDVANGGRDKAYKTDGTPQQVVWSIGPLNSNDQAAKHHAVGGRITAAKTINFGRAIQDNCRIFEPKDKVVLPNFKPYHIYGGSGIVFTVEIGQSASEQGYQAITGQPSWGIAWYINGILAPELHLKRGESYTFRVAGGDNSTQGSKYHPFYFTDSVKGGYGVNSQGTIYPGSVNGQSMEKAVGGYCEWMLDLNAEEKVYNCFDEYKADLRLRCDDNPGRYTEFVFTPSAAMPDVIYYQCYTHVNLGWKINLLDELPVDPIMNPPCIEPPTAPTTTPGPVAPATPSGGTIPTSQEGTAVPPTPDNTISPPTQGGRVTSSTHEGTTTPSTQGEATLPASGKASETKATQPLTAAIQACCVVVHVFMWAKDAIPPAV